MSPEAIVILAGLVVFIVLMAIAFWGWMSVGEAAQATIDREKAIAAWYEDEERD